MYTIVHKINLNKYLCTGDVQDGTERWEEETREKAIFSMIKFARVMNGTFITEKDINFYTDDQPALSPVEKFNFQLLEDIRRGAKVVLPHDDIRIKMSITEKECDLIRQYREGEITFTERN